MRLLRGALLLLVLPLAMGASEPILVPDVSQREIQIRYSFSGAELLLFGAVLYPGGHIPTERVDIAVVVKGPMQPILVREKQKIAGIWMNVASERFRSAPGFYAVASSRPLADLVDDRTAAIYELGVQNLQLSPGTGSNPLEQRRFESGLIDLQQRRKLYLEEPRGVEITDGVLYRARIGIPARVPTGNYTAETFLIRNGRVVTAAVRDIRIEKLGFERFISSVANRWSLAYGACAVAISLLLGWAGSALFRRT